MSSLVVYRRYLQWSELDPRIPSTTKVIKERQQINKPKYVAAAAAAAPARASNQSLLNSLSSLTFSSFSLLSYSIKLRLLYICVCVRTTIDISLLAATTTDHLSIFSLLLFYSHVSRIICTVKRERETV